MTADKIGATIAVGSAALFAGHAVLSALRGEEKMEGKKREE
jgi:hypothetical protein